VKEGGKGKGGTNERRKKVEKMEAEFPLFNSTSTTAQW